MDRIYHKAVLTFVTAILFLSVASAQTRSVGTSWSFSGIGLTYSHEAGNRSFFDIQCKVELGEVLMNRTNIPGVSLAFTRNYIIREWDTEDGNTIYLISGPGISAGWSSDFLTNHGIHIGLKGCFGIECRYRRNINLSFCLAPVIGVHISKQNDYMKMEYHRNGLLGTILPEVGIKYSF